MIQFSPDTQNEFQHLLTKFPNKRSSLLMVLRLAEKDFGAITPEVCKYVANILDLSPSHVLGVYTFYTHYRRPFHGKHRIMICCTYMCAMKGSLDILQYLKSKLKIDIGEKTPDGKFSIEKCECLGACGTAPVMIINNTYYENLDKDRIDQILNSLE